MNRNTKHSVRNSHAPTEAKEREGKNKNRESRKRRRVKHSMHILSKDGLEKEKKKIEKGDEQEHKTLCMKLTHTYRDEGRGRKRKRGVRAERAGEEGE
jgi:hypothetical protein